jgi:prepilin-type N-terminal cleavage/methylation domain-containing protein
MNRAGMTLLEVLLAVSISLVLALGIYQAVVMHYAQTDSGREKAARSQIVRGVLGQMQRDMRNVFTGWRPVSKDASQAGDASDDPATGREEEEESAEQSDEDAGPSATESAGSSSFSSSSSSSVTSSPSQFEVPAGGVLGLPDAVTLITRRTPAGLDFRPTLSSGEARPPVSDLRLVRYWFGSPGAETQDNRMGLVRQEINYVPDVTAGDDPLSGARTEILAEEVRSVQFRYFDGYGWLTEWSQTSERPPQAIEVTVALPRQLNSNSPLPANGPPTSPVSAAGAMSTATNEDLEYLRIVVSSQDLAPPDEASGASSSSSSSSSSAPASGAPTSTGGSR